ncbi:MAG: DUF4405 domain-containing protein [Chloroflexales bacterium]
MIQTAKRPSRNLINLAIDMAIFVAFLVAMAPRFSGLAIHEWLGVAFGAAITTHLLLHWQWIMQVTKRFFGKVQWSARLNYALNALLFIDMTVIVFTGLMISEAVLPTFGLAAMRGGAWKGLHTLSANLSVFLVGLHVALHWQWIVNMTRRFIIAPLMPRRALPQPARAARPALKEEGVLR